MSCNHDKAETMINIIEWNLHNVPNMTSLCNTWYAKLSPVSTRRHQSQPGHMTEWRKLTTHSSHAPRSCLFCTKLNSLVHGNKWLNKAKPSPVSVWSHWQTGSQGQWGDYTPTSYFSLLYLWTVMWFHRGILMLPSCRKWLHLAFPWMYYDKRIYFQ